MPKADLILQGFTSGTHAEVAKDLFDLPDIERIVIGVAFVSENGVEQIEELLRPYANVATVYAGIRNEITSHQGLLRLYGLGVRLYTVDTGSASLIYHPKLYAVRGSSTARVLVGSANLTLGGLRNNVEAGVLLQFDLSDSDDSQFVNRIETEFDRVPNDYPNHVKEITALALLDEMLAAGLLVDELVSPPPRVGFAAQGAVSGALSRIPLKVPWVRSTSRLAKTVASTPTSSTSTPTAGSSPAAMPTGAALQLVWESKPLTRRDLTIPTATGTNPTGSMNLDKGLLPDHIDHRHYFRDSVFSALSWVPRSTTVDEASGRFQVILGGIGHGEHNLQVHHSTSTTSPTYLQRNAMTRLSWGPIRALVARDIFIGRTLRLYRDAIDQTWFRLEID
jgi:HKD family nuclease